MNPSSSFLQAFLRKGYWFLLMPDGVRLCHFGPRPDELELTRVEGLVIKHLHHLKRELRELSYEDTD